MDPLYHVTYFANLGEIADVGLVPDVGEGIRPIALRGHGAGAVFLTEAEGVPFWGQRAEEWAEARVDDPGADGLVPVVLRITAEIDDEELLEDEVGTADAKAPSYLYEGTIDPEEIEVWTGGEWVPVEDYEAVQLEDAVDEDGFLLLDSPLIPSRGRLTE